MTHSWPTNNDTQRRSFCECSVFARSLGDSNACPRAFGQLRHIAGVIVVVVVVVLQVDDAGDIYYNDTYVPCGVNCVPSK